MGRFQAIQFLLLSHLSSTTRAWSLDRRRALKVAVTGLFAPIPVNAACLPGDLSKECIGVYKVPLDPEIDDFVNTEEALKKFAPDIKFVPPVQSPKSARDALDVLYAQRKAADDIREVVTAGRLEEAGIKVLNLIPKVTMAGRVAMASSLEKDGPGGVSEVRQIQVQSTLDQLLGLFGQCDVSIGQGLRGEMGVSAVAQLNILSDLKDATIAFDDFLALVDKK